MVRCVARKSFSELLESVRWMKRHRAGQARGRASEASVPDVKLVRQRTKLPQSDFARLIGVSVRTLQNWEQGHRHPTGPAAALLRAVSANPKAVIDALHR
jgi:putative transcriptional regulator